jgi:hypothetical protein
MFELFLKEAKVEVKFIWVCKFGYDLVLSKIIMLLLVYCTTGHLPVYTDATLGFSCFCGLSGLRVLILHLVLFYFVHWPILGLLYPRFLLVSIWFWSMTCFVH